MFYVRFASFEHKLYFVLIRKSKKLHFPLIWYLKYVLIRSIWNTCTS
jgi:hypothetical protein